MHIAVINNYPLEKMRRLAERGGIPGQHAWGVDALERAGHTLDFAPFHEVGERDPLDLLSRSTHQALGQLDQELHALRSRANVIYCADGRSARGLALLPRARRSPLVTVVHHPIAHNAINRAVMRGTDTVLCLTEHALNDAIRLGARDATIALWGPDLTSPLYALEKSEALGIVSAGKNQRDLRTLIEALRQTGQPATIYDLEGQLSDAPTHVRVVRQGGAGCDPDAPGAYLPQRVISDLAQASVVAIPLRAGSGLAGLTEVNDALALGKPIVMTRLPAFPFDLELARCGLMVAPGDVAGWVRALEQLKDPATRSELGARGRNHAERGLNYQTFCKQVVLAVKRAPV